MACLAGEVGDLVHDGMRVLSCKTRRADGRHAWTRRSGKRRAGKVVKERREFKLQAFARVDGRRCSSSVTGDRHAVLGGVSMEVEVVVLEAEKSIQLSSEPSERIGYQVAFLGHVLHVENQGPGKAESTAQRYDLSPYAATLAKNHRH
jgi:hypothetical protein